jgi:hypothetical protein
MTRIAVSSLVVLLLACAPARAQVEGDTWIDPTLAEAVRAANLIVLAECTDVARGGGAAYRVTKVFKGPPRKDVMVVGLHPPGASADQRTVAVGDQAYLLLQGDPEGPILSVPTPTFGRFPSKETGVVAAFSDTFVRVAVAAPRWEQVLEGLVRGAPDPALLADARALLAAKDTDPNDLYVALEVLSSFGEEQDRARAEAVLDDPRFASPERFRLRVAALNVLAHLGGAATAERLVALIERDALDVVKSAAATALAPVLRDLHRTDADGVREVTERLAALANEARSTPVRFGAASDPRENQLDGLLGAILKTLGTVRSKAGVAPALRALERVDDGDALVAGLTFFSALNDPDQAGAVAWRMREKDAEDAYFNPLFVRTLQGLTGQRLGDDRAAWVRWCRERALLPAGHDQPLGPEAPPTPPGGAPR